MDDDCEHCNLDRLQLEDLISCTRLSIFNLITDLRYGNPPMHAFMKDDRILYLLLLLLTYMTMRTLMKTL